MFARDDTHAPRGNGVPFGISPLWRAAMALVLALAIWLVTKARENVSEWVRLDVSMAGSEGNILPASDTPVYALMNGRRAEIVQLLRRAPVLRRARAVSSSDSMTLEFNPSDVELPDGSSLSVRAITPRTVTFRLPRRAAR